MGRIRRPAPPSAGRACTGSACRWHWPRSRRKAQQLADDAIRRAREGRWEGNVYTPDQFKKPPRGGDDVVRLWDVESGESRALHGHHEEVLRVLFVQGGTGVVSSSSDGTVRLWKDDLPHGPAALRARLAAFAGAP